MVGRRLLATSVVVVSALAGVSGAPAHGAAAVASTFDGYAFLNSDGSLFISTLGPSLRENFGPVFSPAVAVGARGSFTVAFANGRVRQFVPGPPDRIAEVPGAFGKLRPGETVVSIETLVDFPSYWLFTSQGRVFTFGTAKKYGDLNGRHLNAPIVGSVLSRDGKGYSMVAADGGVFAFGSARFFGSMGGKHLNAPIVDIERSVGDHPGVNDGYYLVAADGGVFAFRAVFRGSMSGRHLNAPVSGIVASGRGYVLVARDGGAFNFSERRFFGSAVGRFSRPDVVAIVLVPLLGALA